MNIAQLKRAIKYLPTDMSIMLRGKHGIGKTEWVKQLAKELGLNLVIWHASHAADAGDLTGLPYKAKIKLVNTETGEEYEQEVTRFAPPEWMLQDRPSLVLLDEINRGMSIAMNAIMQFTNDGTYDNVKLPAGSRIIACINPDQDNTYDVTSLDPAQLSRFSMYDFNPTEDEWIDYMVEKYGVNIVTMFITKNKQYLDPDGNAELAQTVQARDGEMLPDRRKWEKVWRTIKNGIDDNNVWNTPDGFELLGDILHGMVGVGAATAFIDFWKNNKEMLDPEEVMTKKWKDEYGVKINNLAMSDQPSAIAFVKNCALWCKQHEDEVIAMNADNFLHVVNSLTKDAKVAVCTSVVYSAIEQGASWAKKICKLSPELKETVRKAKTVVDV